MEGQFNTVSIKLNSPLGPIACPAVGSWPSSQYKLSVLSCGIGLKSNHKAVGSPQNTCANIVAMGIACQPSHCCTFQHHSWVRLPLTFLSQHSTSGAMEANQQGEGSSLEHADFSGLSMTQVYGVFKVKSSHQISSGNSLHCFMGLWNPQPTLCAS